MIQNSSTETRVTLKLYKFIGLHKMLMYARPEGIEFEANNYDQPLHVGDVVTFSFSTYSTTGKPIEPTILQVRKDISWRDVVVDSISSFNSMSGNFTFCLV